MPCLSLNLTPHCCILSPFNRRPFFVTHTTSSTVLETPTITSEFWARPTVRPPPPLPRCSEHSVLCRPASTARACFHRVQEARLERAEGAEVKSQLREALAELESDRNGQDRRARHNLQVDSSCVLPIYLPWLYIMPCHTIQRCSTPEYNRRPPFAAYGSEMVLELGLGLGLGLTLELGDSVNCCCLNFFECLLPGGQIDRCASPAYDNRKESSIQSQHDLKLLQNDGCCVDRWHYYCAGPVQLTKRYCLVVVEAFGVGGGA